MKKYKIAVYAICKNEEKHIQRWYDSVKDADSINVIDTGSTDNSVNLLKKLGVNVVVKKIEPFRFDEARNESLKIIPTDTDICICTDIDEVISKSWRKEIENKWKDDTTVGEYSLNSSLDKEGNPLVSFNIRKIHSFKHYKWVYPVHEILSFIGKNEKVVKLNIFVDHMPDETKSRSSYLPLLELAVKEDPTNDRHMHYLGREYMYYSYYNKAIDTLIKHLNLPSAVWKEERCASMRFIARCYMYLNRTEEARMWLNKAIKEAPKLRDPYVELAFLEYDNKRYDISSYLIKQALNIKENPKTYINEAYSYNYEIYDLLSVCEYNLGNTDEAIRSLDKAIELEPNNQRLLDNLKFMKTQE